MTAPAPHATPSSPQWVESIYERLAADTDGRVCKAIADEAGHEAPGNFLRMLLANAASQVADSLASAKTTLPWLMLHLGAPTWMTSTLVPIRETGAMLPQLLLGALVGKLAPRKWVWVAGARRPGRRDRPAGFVHCERRTGQLAQFTGLGPDVRPVQQTLSLRWPEVSH